MGAGGQGPIRIGVQFDDGKLQFLRRALTVSLSSARNQEAWGEAGPLGVPPDPTRIARWPGSGRCAAT